MAMVEHPIDIRNAEAESIDETDSALGGDASVYTESIRSSLLESIKEGGRTFHKFHAGQATYILPDDEQEQSRLDLQHEICMRTFDGKLALAPLPPVIDHARKFDWSNVVDEVRIYITAPCRYRRNHVLTLGTRQSI